MKFERNIVNVLFILSLLVYSLHPNMIKFKTKNADNAN